MSEAIQKEKTLAKCERLWQDADQLWDRFAEDTDFEQYVSADYELVFAALWQLRGKLQHVLEWGSGLGVVTLMAAEMGFDAYGIEAEPRLVDFAEVLAERYDIEARFATGSFIPDEFEWSPSCEDSAERTMMLDGAAAYSDLDMELRDFDLVYAYPWPDEHKLYRSIMEGHAAPHALLLTYDGREGMDTWRSGDDRLTSFGAT
ncbi:MAG: hypothetical protein AAGF97_16730 [Planctomycetota bacterium]